MDGIRKGDNTAEWLMWLKYHRQTKFPLFVPFPIQGFDFVVPYPLEEVVNRTGETWYENTLAYAIAYACAIGSVRRIDFWGCDFNYTEKIKQIVEEGKTAKKDAEVVEQEARVFVHNIELGHACGAYWAGICRGFNIQTRVWVGSSFLAWNTREFYGYGDRQPDIKSPVHNRTVTIK